MVHYFEGFTVIFHRVTEWRFRNATAMNPAKLYRTTRIARVEIHAATDQDELEARR